jgi:hypothetical protein
MNVPDEAREPGAWGHLYETALALACEKVSRGCVLTRAERAHLERCRDNARQERYLSTFLGGMWGTPLEPPLGHEWSTVAVGADPGALLPPPSIDDEILDTLYNTTAIVGHDDGA